MVVEFREFKRTKICTTPVNIIFNTHDVVQHHDKAFVVIIEVVGRNVSGILVDMRSLVNIIFKHALEQLDVQRSTMEEATTPLIGFLGGSVWSLDITSLPLSVSKGSVVVVTMVKFVVVDQSSSYNVILWRPFMVTTKAYVSLYHIKMKISVKDIIITIRGDQRMSQSYYEVALEKNLQVKAVDNAQKRNAASNTKNNVQATKCTNQRALEYPR